MRRLLQLGTLLVSAYYALWACAPAATFRPINDLPVDGNEFGLGAVGSTDLETTDCTRDLTGCGPGYGGQLWYTHRFGRFFSLGGTLFGGNKAFAGAGVQARFHWVDLDRFQFGTDLEGGFAYGAIGLPVGVRLADGFWLYTNPSFGARLFQSARVPLGVNWQIGDHFGLMAEGAYGYDALSTTAGTNSISFGLAASYRF